MAAPHNTTSRVLLALLFLLLHLDLTTTSTVVGTTAAGANPPTLLLSVPNQGLDLAANRAPHSWQQASIVYFPAPPRPAPCAAIVADATSNSFFVAASLGAAQYADAPLQLHYPPLDAQIGRVVATNWTGASMLRLRLQASLTSNCSDSASPSTLNMSAGRPLNITLFARRGAGVQPPLPDPFVCLGTVELPASGASPTWVELAIPPAAQVAAVDMLLLRVPCQPAALASGAPDLYHHVALSAAALVYAAPLRQEAETAVGVESAASAARLQLASVFGGHALWRRYGSYSATGFVDADGALHVLFGGGIPEGPSSDNVYYFATGQPLPYTGPTPARLLIGDPQQTLWPFNRSPGYGGDPSVVQLSPTGASNQTFAMFFSGLAVDRLNRTGRNDSRPLWNQIFRAVSHSGPGGPYVLDPPDGPVVAAATGGAAGYGSGSPSVVLLANGTLIMWYYSQTEVPTRGGTYVRLSTDGGCSFSAPQSMDDNYGGIDCKRWPEAQAFLCSGYDAERGVFVFTSRDGLRGPGAASVTYIQQAPPPSHLCHNPGWLAGDPRGWLRPGEAAAGLQLSYGISIAPFSQTEYDTRQMGITTVFASVEV